MKYLTALLLVSSLIVSSCVSKKVAQKGKESQRVHSQQDFPYIEAFHNGMRYKLKGDVDGAIAAFQNCLAMRQDDDAVFYALGQLYSAKNDVLQATSMLQKAHAIDPKNIWYTEELAVVHYDAQQFDKAAVYFKKLVAYQPQNLAWLYGYGDCLLRTGKVEESIQVLNKAEDVMGINPGLSLEKYNLYMSMKKDKEALNELDKVLKVYPNEPQIIANLVDHYFKKGDMDKGIIYLRQLTEADPSNGRAHFALGEINRQKGNMKEAMKSFLLAFKSPDVDVDTKMALLINLQESPIGKSKEVMELVELMPIVHPNDAKSHSIKGDYLAERGDEQGALDSYKEALKYDKKQFAIWNQVMIMTFQKGDMQSLYDISTECLTYFRTQPMVFLFHGVSATELKKYDEGLESLLAGKSLVVNNDAMEAEFLSQLGEVSFRKNNFSEGKKYYEEALKLNPQSNFLKNNYAYRLAQSNVELTFALSLIEQAIARSPKDANYVDTRGFIRFQQGKYADALEDFQLALELQPNQAVILEHVGDAYSKLGNVEKALEFWKKALEFATKKEILNKKIETRTYHENVD